MQVYKISPYGFGCNSYILTADGKNAVIIDCASAAVYDACIRKNLTPVAVLLTHGHFDHVGGCGEFYSHGVKIYCGADEKDFIHSAENKDIFGGVYIPDFEVYKTFSDGETVTLGGVDFKVISTPGHTAGGVCYLAGDCLFTGDTLFCGSAGRCDLPTGNAAQLIKSVNKLFSLDGDYKVYCGHEEDTTLDKERRFNQYAR